MKILGIGGTLRKGSFSKSLLLEAQVLAPKDTVIEITEIGDFPLYNPDIPMPDKVKEFKEKIKQADALLFSTAEYNYSVPGALKNAIDWGSRPFGDNSFEDKPAAIISESTGLNAGTKAYFHLRQMMIYLNVHVLNKPEVWIPNIKEKIDPSGKITDEHTKEKLIGLINALIKWSERLNR
jgi:chromate reductase, NAD(P)H dehydrogenase (quinone)